MKKLINDVGDVVPQMLEGLVVTHPGLRLLHDGAVVVRSNVADLVAAGTVTIVSGGGAGHEPAHGGYVGEGMLTAAVAGEVFTSPSVDSVLTAVRAVAGPGGVLLVVKNYTGDRLNFGLAAEIARAEGADVAMVVVADDVALAAAGSHAGRRGIAGTVLVHKVAGAAAAQGLPLAEVARLAGEAAEAVGTMGVALSPCTVPAVGEPGFVLGPDEVEWGLGIHGEQGVERGTLVPADAVAERLVAAVVDDRGVVAGDRVALLVNNLGGTPPMELDVVARAAVAALRTRAVVVERAWVGTFLSSLDMAGCSVSVLALDDDRLARLDLPTRTAAWPAAHLGPVAAAVEAVGAREPTGTPAGGLEPDAPLRRVLVAVCEALLAAEPELTRMDGVVGDGDLGTSLARGARHVLAELDGYPSASSPADVLRAVSATVRRVVGGTSGPLYAILLLRAAAVLDGAADGAEPWGEALAAGARGISDVGGAGVGDRTMLDALVPAADALAAGAPWPATLRTAVAAAAAGAESTGQMAPRVGRSSYLGDRAIGHVDPGAHAVALWLAAIAEAL